MVPCKGQHCLCQHLAHCSHPHYPSAEALALVVTGKLLLSGKRAQRLHVSHACGLRMPDASAAASSIGQVLCRRGEAVTVFDGRPNSELILATGRVEEDSPSDYLTISVGLVLADRMYSTKKEILKAMGFEGVQVGFP